MRSRTISCWVHHKTQGAMSSDYIRRSTKNQRSTTISDYEPLPEVDYQTISDYIRLYQTTTIFHFYSNGSSFRTCLKTYWTLFRCWNRRQGVTCVRASPHFVVTGGGDCAVRLLAAVGWWHLGIFGWKNGDFNVEFRSDSPKKWGFQFWFNDFGWIWDLRSPKTSGFKNGECG